MLGIDLNKSIEIKARMDIFAKNVDADLIEINKNFLNMISNYSGPDLNFLTEKIDDIISQYGTVTHNNIVYCDILSEIIKSYQCENDKIKQDLSTSTSH